MINKMVTVQLVVYPHSPWGGGGYLRMKLVCMCRPVSKIRGLSGFQPLQQDWPLAAYKYQIIVLGLVLRARIGTEIKCFFKIKLILA